MCPTAFFIISTLSSVVNIGDLLLLISTPTISSSTMAAKVESMFYVRTAPWHGLGVRVEEALTSQDALHYSGLDWTVRQETLMTDTYLSVPGCKANIRNDNNAILGLVSELIFEEIISIIVDNTSWCLILYLSIISLR